MKVAALFEEEPRRWGLRGDPHLWHALRLRLADEDLPGSVEEVMDLVRAAFGELAGTDLDSAPENSAPENSAPENSAPENSAPGQMVYREQYAHGGMSSGWISLGTWREQLMPLIAERAAAALAAAALAAGGPIEGARIVLTPLTVGDAEEMTGVLGGEQLYGFTGGRPPTTGELRTRYARQVAGRSADGREEWRNWIIRRAADGQAVGFVQATIAEQAGEAVAEIAWVVGLAWQGNGYAGEAARALVGWLDARGVAAIQAHIHPGHTASAAVARSAGLVPAGQFEDGEQLWRRRRPD
jgi:RimJ/RimL family protein N-acetyltransferase